MQFYPFSAMLARMKYISRWGLMRSSRTESLCEHTADTALLAHTLALISVSIYGTQVRCETVCVAALYHDASEILTGDMPTPIKYDNPTIQSAYKEVEAVAERKLLELLPPELRGVYKPILTPRDPEILRLVKAADKLSAYIKCVEELKAGNLEFREAAAQTRQIVEGYGLPEVAYFLDTFMDSFSLTLDQLKSPGDPQER